MAYRDQEKTKGKLKLLIDNILVYGAGGVISKAIPLIMVPIITRMMPGTEYYGISDLANTIVSFGSAMAIMGMYDAMFRLFFDYEDAEGKIKVCSTTIRFTLIMSTAVSVVLFLLRNFVAGLFFGNTKYSYVVSICSLSVFAGALNTIMGAPTRMMNQRKVHLVTNTVSPLLSYFLALCMLRKEYYVIALPLAMLISVSVMGLSFYILNKRWFSLHIFDSCILKELLQIALPITPVFLFYWIFNSCDKLMIANILGVRDAGIYSVASKLGHASQLIYLAFAGGWQYFAFSTMNDDRQVESNSRIFEYMGILSYIATGFVCIASYGVFKLLFRADYLSGYIAAPYLFLSPLLLMLYQIIGNQFLVIKKTWPALVILSIGVIANVILNWWLIPLLGIEGAAIATLCGYACVVIIASVVLMKIRLLVVRRQFLITSAFFTVFFVVWRLFFATDIFLGLCANVIFLLPAYILYRNEISVFIHKLRE